MAILVNAARMEESASWRMPADLAAMLFAVHDQLEDLVESGADANGRSAAVGRPSRSWLRLLLDGGPQTDPG